METNYYVNQLNTYNINYNDAIRKIDNIKNKLQTLYNSFNGANGDDIINIQSDLKKLIDKLSEQRSLMMDALCKSNDNASSCERCYYYWFYNSGYIDVGIDKTDGRVYGTEYIPDTHEYRDPNLLEMILGISTARAEGMDVREYHKATIEEMLTKY